MITYSIIVSGKVQGVFFRQTTKQFATQIGITGTVQNLPNGEVQIIATATATQLRLLLDWCAKGPEQAKVVNLVWENILPQAFEKFSVIK